MGIRNETIGLIVLAAKNLGGYKGLSMCELGNQHIRHRRNQRAKPYFEARGVRHVSIDINGQDGALPLDLNEELPDLGQFDLVTNYGTSEHIKDQYQVFRNVHNLTRIGGMMVHAVPCYDFWPFHGLYGYRDGFFKHLALANEYGVLFDSLIPRELPADNRRWLTCTVLRKTKDPFISRTDFEGIGLIQEYVREA